MKTSLTSLSNWHHWNKLTPVDKVHNLCVMFYAASPFSDGVSHTVKQIVWMNEKFRHILISKKPTQSAILSLICNFVCVRWLLPKSVVITFSNALASSRLQISSRWYDVDDLQVIQSTLYRIITMVSRYDSNLPYFKSLHWS